MVATFNLYHSYLSFHSKVLVAGPPELYCETNNTLPVGTTVSMLVVLKPPILLRIRCWSAAEPNGPGLPELAHCYVVCIFIIHKFWQIPE